MMSRSFYAQVSNSEEQSSGRCKDGSHHYLINILWFSFYWIYNLELIIFLKKFLDRLNILISNFIALCQKNIFPVILVTYSWYVNFPCVLEKNLLVLGYILCLLMTKFKSVCINLSLFYHFWERYIISMSIIKDYRN